MLSRYVMVSIVWCIGLEGVALAAPSVASCDGTDVPVSSGGFSSSCSSVCTISSGVATCDPSVLSTNDWNLFGTDTASGARGDFYVFGSDNAVTPHEFCCRIIDTADELDMLLVEGSSGSDVIDLDGTLGLSGVTVKYTTPVTGPAFRSYGLAGNDTIFGSNGSSAPELIDGGYGSDTVWAGGGDDVIFGDDRNSSGNTASDGADTLYGEGGADFIYGQGGNDVIEGGAGDDDLFGDLGTGETCDEYLDGADRIAGNGGADYIAGCGGGDTIFGGTQDGTNIACTTATDLDDIIMGGGGADTILGCADADDIYGGPGNDTLRGVGGADNIDGGTGSDTMLGGLDADNICADSTGDSVSGEGGDDKLYTPVSGLVLFDGGNGTNDQCTPSVSPRTNCEVNLSPNSCPF